MSGSTPKSAYRMLVRVRFHECDPLGHVNNAVYLNYLEQVAIDHATAVGWSQTELETEVGGVFVARRHEIDYLRPAVDGDQLEVITWAETMGMATAIRRYVIRRMAAGEDPELVGLIAQPDVDSYLTGEVVVTAQTRWALIRRDSGRPMRIPRKVIDDFVELEPGVSTDDERCADQVDAETIARHRAAGRTVRCSGSHRARAGWGTAVRGNSER